MMVKWGYLISYDGIIEDLYLTALNMGGLKTMALMSKAKHILYLIDTCYVGLATINTRGMEPENTFNYISKITIIHLRKLYQQVAEVKK